MKLRLAGVAIQKIRDRIAWKYFVAADHGLLADQVHDNGSAGWRVVDAVVGRPGLLGIFLADHADREETWKYQNHGRHRGKPDGPPWSRRLSLQEINEARGDECEPEDRGHPKRSEAEQQHS